MNEYLQRIKTNKIDIATAFSPGQMLDYRVPVPMFVTKPQFLTAYKLTGKSFKPVDVATVFENATLLEPPVYAGSLLLILSFFLAIFIHVWTKQQPKKKERPTSGKKNDSFISRVLRESAQVFYDQSDLRLISLPFVILCFYLITCFGSLYETSCIVVDRPYVVSNYQQLIKDKTAVPGFSTAWLKCRACLELLQMTHWGEKFGQKW